MNEIEAPATRKTRVEFDELELRSLKGISRELAWRIAGNGPYEHRPAKPRWIQADLQEKVRGVGRYRAGLIYRKLVEPREI